MDKRIYSLLHLPDKNKVLYCSRPISAFIFYREFKLDLLTGKKTSSQVDDIHDILEQYKISEEYDQPVFFHLFYEFGFSCNELEHLLPAHKPLAIIIKYSEAQIMEKSNSESNDQDFKLEITEYPSFDDYHKKFERVYQHLIDGDCYQVNLTEPFYFKFDSIDDPRSFIYEVWNRTLAVGAYAHATYIDSLGKLFLSNSPECLFEVKKQKDDFIIQTMPIKGTLKLSDESQREELWELLKKSKKDQAELYMITDLLRNDLTKINLTPAKVVDKKLPLYVPGLVHQYSKLQVKADELTTLDQVIKAVFPGGSITGAPKKRVLQIISDVEKYNRGFYCGSTVVFYESIKAASINIRSAEIDLTQKELFYGAGGAITLLSQVREEFDESYAKMESFLHFLKVKNINKS